MAEPTQEPTGPLVRRARSGSALNLASNPIGGYRTLFALACAAAVGLLVVAGLLLARFLSSEGPPDMLQGMRAELEQEQRELRARGTRASARLQGERAVEVLETTGFLNQLLVRKGVSWTQTFLDLEQVLPPEVRVVSIEPEVAFDDTIRLDMALSARAPENFIEFLKSLEGSDLFGSAELRGSLPPTESDPTFQYHLAVQYDQQL